MVGLSLNVGSMSYAFVSNSMNNALSTMLIVFEIEEANKGYARSFLTSSMYVGAFLGTVLSQVSVGLGYRANIFLLDIFMIVGSVMQISDNLYLFLLGRLIAGLGCGMNSIFISLFIRMFCPTEIYSTVGGLTSSV